jgi:hypothetical protein
MLLSAGVGAAETLRTKGTAMRGNNQLPGSTDGEKCEIGQCLMERG